MTLLARVPISPDELTQRSFLSRLAGVTGCPSAAQFCKETGLDWVALSQGRSDQLSRLAELSGADANTVRRNASRRHCLGSYEIRGCHILSNMIRNDEYALCPTCIADDVLDGMRAPAFERAYLRIAWHLRSIHTCIIHHKPLVSFPLKTMRSDKRQFSVFGWEAALELTERSAANVDQTPTDFEAYICRRLEGASRETWLDEMPFSEVTRLSAALGGSIVSGVVEWRSAGVAIDVRAAENAGYQLLRQGPRELQKYLQTRMLSARGSPKTVGVRTLIGPAAMFLDQRRNQTTDFRLFRREIELFAGRELGQSTGRFRLKRSGAGYTVTDLAERFRLERSALESAARRIGADFTDDERLDSLVSGQVVREARRMWRNREVRLYLGISNVQLWALADRGLLGKVERQDLHKANRCFDPVAVEKLLTQVLSATSQNSTETREWITIPEAAARFRCGLAAVVQLLLDRVLKNVIHIADHPGLSGIRVCADETFRRIFGLDSAGISMRQTARRLGTTFEVVSALLAEGLILHRKIEKPRSTQVVVSEESIAAFEREYVSLTNLSKAYGISTRRMNSDLATRGISPAIWQRTCGATFFRRAGLLA